MIHRMLHYAYIDLIVQGGKLILVVDTYKIPFEPEHVVLIYCVLVWSSGPVSLINWIIFSLLIMQSGSLPLSVEVPSKIKPYAITFRQHAQALIFH
jgi:hypothetical protein